MSLKAVAALVLAVAAPGALAQDHSHHEHAQEEGAGHDAMAGALGPQPMAREASGTSWQPDTSEMAGIHAMRGEWMLMVHGYADLVYDRQGGQRGDEKVFVPSMLMAMAQRPAGPGTWGVRTMLSLDPLMGRDGYPLLLQTGETADGVEELVDRQHPHDFFMELATTYSVPVGAGSVFGYVGLPGEPALGPPAFMHRASGVRIPEAPLSHHWLDSTHITFGVVTLGATTQDFKLEASAFNGREPDQHRWNIETDTLDSWSARLSWNPGPTWSLQASHGRLKEPEQLEPDEDVERTTASITYATSNWATTVAAGMNRHEGHSSPAYVLESTRQVERITWFGRAEWLENEHLVVTAEPHEVGKLSLGGSYRAATAGRLAFDVGALLSGYRIPGEIEAEYGENPVSGMVFVRTSLE
jgi:hypothetical protein